MIRCLYKKKDYNDNEVLQYLHLEWKLRNRFILIEDKIVALKLKFLQEAKGLSSTNRGFYGRLQRKKERKKSKKENLPRVKKEKLTIKKRSNETTKENSKKTRGILIKMNNKNEVI